jgi:hypothetical protein
MKFRLELDGEHRDYRATQVHQFCDDVCMAMESEGYKYFVDGKAVSRDDALMSCEGLIEAAWNKKNKTHKRVMVSVGSR